MVLTYGAGVMTERLDLLRNESRRGALAALVDRSFERRREILDTAPIAASDWRRMRAQCGRFPEKAEITVSIH
jgi:hypothetical protein